MTKRILIKDGKIIALISSGSPVITDVQSTLDLIADIQYSDDCDLIAINKEGIIEDFFKLSTGIAGEVLQKIVNYSKKLAVIGDFSVYTSKPLQDFIYECNKGRHVFFVSSEDEAIDKLSGIN